MNIKEDSFPDLLLKEGTHSDRLLLSYTVNLLLLFLKFFEKFRNKYAVFIQMDEKLTQVFYQQCG